MSSEVETSIWFRMRFDSLTSRSLSFRRPRLCRGFPGRSILDYALLAPNDRVIERWRLNSFMAGIVVKPRARILHGHDWVFSSEVLKVFGNPADGDVISLKDGKDHLIGSAIYNSKSQIVARRFSRRRQDLDQDFFRRRIEQASEYRDRRNIDAKLRRVVWSESDGLPGVIIDRYGDDFVLQTLTLAMDMRKDLITAAMVDLFTATSLSSNETTRRFARRRDWNYAAAFCAELHRKSRSKSKG